MRARGVNFQKGQDPKKAMGIGKRKERSETRLKEGDIIEVLSEREDRWILVQIAEEKPSDNWSSDSGSWMDAKVKILDDDYDKSNLYDTVSGDAYIQIYPDHFDFWQLWEH